MTEPKGVKAKLAQYLRTLASGGAEQVERDHIAEGMTAFAQGDHAAAAVALVKGLHEHPEHLQARLTLVRIALKAREFLVAEARVCEAVAVHPNEPAVHTLFGEIRHAQRSYDHAMSCFKAAIRLAPKFVEAHLRMGILLFELGSMKEALEALEHAIVLDKTNANTRYYIAQICLEYEDFKRALIQSHWAEKSDPSFRPIYLLRADIFEHLGDWRNAVAELSKLDEMGMADPTVFVRLGIGQLELKAKALAQRSFEKAIELEWHCLEARYHLAKLHEEQQHLDLALDAYKLLVSSKTYGATAKQAIARIEGQLAEIEARLAQAAAPVDEAPQQPAPVPGKPRLADLVGQRPTGNLGRKNKLPLPPARPAPRPMPPPPPKPAAPHDARSQFLQMQLVMAMFMELSAQQQQESGPENP